MDNKKNLHFCRVCGLFQGDDYFPWGKDGNSPSFDFCECCGVEFGYGDCFLEEIKAFREEWLKKGSPWRFPEYKPEDWYLEEQLKAIPKEFRSSFAVLEAKEMNY